MRRSSGGTWGGVTVCGALLIVAALVAAAPRGSNEAAAAQPRIVNGLSTADYPTVGALVYLGGGSDPYHEQGCTGTLIGCSTFLTAAHCVIDEPGPSGYLVFLPHAGFFAVASTTIDPSYDANGDATGDIAVLILSTPVTGISPTRINTVAAVAPDTVGTIVGYGVTSGQEEDNGIKRTGNVTTAACPVSVSDDATSVCWRFDNPLGPAGSDSNTCLGDSGGPLFVGDGASQVVAGVTSFGTNDLCLPLDISADASVFASQSFIIAQGGADLDNQSCGESLSQVGDADTQVYSVEADILPGTQGQHTFEVSAGTTLLRVALNGEPPSASRPAFDLFVKAGGPPSSVDFDCSSERFGLWQFCKVSSPVAGIWHVLVSPRDAGDSGRYQLVATMFQGAAAPTEPCPAALRADCRTAGNTLLLVKQAAGGDKLIWKWSRGEATSSSEFADPVNSTDYTLCVYGGNEAVGEASVSSSQTKWRSLGAKGYKYKDPTGAEHGIQTVLLKASERDSAKVLVKAKGTNLPYLPLPLSLPVTVQLANPTTGVCWEGRYEESDVTKNEADQFKAKAL